MADISSITLLDGVTYDIKDKSARMVILSYGNSTWADFIAAYNTNTVVYCRASSNSNPASGSQTRLAFMAYVNNGASPTEVEFQYYRSVSSHSDSQQGDQVFVYKLTKTGGWTVTVRSAFTKIVAGTGLSSSYSNDALTLNNTVSYESKDAASGGTDLSLVTTGEKYNWNDKTAISVPVATVDSTSTKTAFTVQVPEFANESALRDGLFFLIYNNKIASASGWTLKVNSFDAKPVYNVQGSRITTGFALNRVFAIWYSSSLISGGCWILGYLTDENTTYASIANITHGAGGGYLADSAVYRYQLLFQMHGNKSEYVTPLNNASNNTGTTKTMLTNVEFDPFGEVLYYNASTTVSSGSRVPGGNSCIVNGAINAQYTFNCGTTLTDFSPLYLKISLQQNGSAKIANSTPWTQTLPSSQDGYYYMFLGKTYSNYQFGLYPTHPIYYHDGTGIKEYINPKDAMVSDVAYDSTNKKITKTINGSTSDVVTISTLKSDLDLDNATTSAAGLMSAADKTTLDAVYQLIYGTGADSFPTNLVDLSLSSTSSKPLANYIVYNLFSDCAVNWRIDEETGLATLVNRFGDDIGDALDIIGAKTYRPRITNLLSDRTLTVGQGSSAILQYSYISVDENDIDDGAGTGVIIVNGASTQSFTVPQGNNSYNVTNLLSPGENSVKVRVTNSEGTTRELAYTVILLSLSITTNLVTPNAYYGSVTFNYILSGYGASKTVHFEMDGTELTSDTISTSGVTTTKVIPAQTSGVHTFRMWATTTVNNVSVTSDALTFSMIWSRAALPDISVEEDQYVIRYFNYDGTYLYGYAADSGDAAINPVTQGLISAPTRSGTSDISYTFSGWADLPASVSKECAVLAQYMVSYRVIFMNGSSTFDTQWVVTGNNASNPSTAPTKAEDNDYVYVFAGWTTTSGGTSTEANALTNVTAARTVYAVYTTINKYTVRFMNGTTVLQTSRVVAGNDATYIGTTPTSTQDGFVFNGWLPLPTNIQADTDCIAQFLDTNTEVNKFLRRTITSYESVASS